MLPVRRAREQGETWNHFLASLRWLVDWRDREAIRRHGNRRHLRVWLPRSLSNTRNSLQVADRAPASSRPATLRLNGAQSDHIQASTWPGPQPRCYGLPPIHHNGRTQQLPTVRARSPGPFHCQQRHARLGWTGHGKITAFVYGNLRSKYSSYL